MDDDFIPYSPQDYGVVEAARYELVASGFTPEQANQRIADVYAPELTPHDLQERLR